MDDMSTSSKRSPFLTLLQLQTNMPPRSMFMYPKLWPDMCNCKECENSNEIDTDDNPEIDYNDNNSDDSDFEAD